VASVLFHFSGSIRMIGIVCCFIYFWHDLLIAFMEVSCMQKLRFTIISSIILTLLYGCETVKGIGRDIENTGDNIQDMLNRSYDSQKI
jgi:predicted small secreted protein